MVTITCCKCKKAIGKVKAHSSVLALMDTHAPECKPAQ